LNTRVSTINNFFGNARREKTNLNWSQIKLCTFDVVSERAQTKANRITRQPFVLQPSGTFLVLLFFFMLMSLFVTAPFTAAMLVWTSGEKRYQTWDFNRILSFWSVDHCATKTKTWNRQWWWRSAKFHTGSVFAKDLYRVWLDDHMKSVDAVSNFVSLHFASP